MPTTGNAATATPAVSIASASTIFGFLVNGGSDAAPAGISCTST